MNISKKNKKEKKFRAAIRYWPVAFRWKLVQELTAGLLTEEQACEKPPWPGTV
jgi:hypothetical protein